MHDAGTTTCEQPGARWHGMPVEGVLSRVEAGERGLPAAEAARRRAKLGRNVLPKARRAGPLELLARQVRTPLVYVLLASAVAAFALGRLIDGIVVAGVVVVDVVLGFVQELRAGKAVDALAGLVPETSTVLRDGRPTPVAAADLVPGDVCLLGPGDHVPADMRLLSTQSLHADEAALTGESVPVEKQVDPVADDAAVADRRSMVHGGTLIASGTGSAVVVSTGAATELGRISRLLKEAEGLETPLTRSLARLGVTLTFAILAVAALIVGVGLLRGYPLVDAILSGISVAVAAIPEGLPAIVTIALSIGVRRMAHRRAVVRRLPAVETLGSTTVICTDKTGTLTRNEMTVRALRAPSGDYEVTGVGYAPEGGLRRDGRALAPPPADVLAIARAGALCNDAALHGADGGVAVVGDPTEGALLVLAEKLGVDVEWVRADLPREDAVPFDARHKYMATLHALPDGEHVAFVKGAPEVVLPRCAGLAGGAPIDAAAVTAEVHTMASRGMRVLALAAFEDVSDRLDDASLSAGGALLGLVGMMDPPRPEAVEAVGACRAAGIAVKMITGDHPATAAAIGAEMGLAAPGEEALTGAAIDALTDDALIPIAALRSVFARVAPEHKLRLVRALQAGGQVAAMTGDGVNDAPALEQADIGVAMGITGTAAAKDAADVVLLDDDFATIRAAVEEGRRVYDNLVKALAFTLPTNAAQAMIVLVAVLFFPIVGGEPLMPILPVQILWVNLVTSVALSLPLAFEAPEPDVMARPPRPPDEPILNAFVLRRTIAVGAYMTAGTVGVFLSEYFAAVHLHVPGALALRESQTMCVTTLALFQAFYLIDCRSLRAPLRAKGLGSNPLVFAGIAALLALQIAFVHAGVMHTLFDSAPIAALDWLECVAVAATVLPAVGAARWWARRRARRAGAA